MRSEEELAGIWRELVDRSGGDLRAAMRELRKITDPMADGDLETYHEGLVLLTIAGKELDRDWRSQFTR